MTPQANSNRWFSRRVSATAIDIWVSVMLISCFVGEGWLSRKRLLAGDRTFLLVVLLCLAVELGLLFLLRSASRKIDAASSAAQLRTLRTVMGISVFSAIVLAEVFNSYARASLDTVAVLEAIGASAVLSVGLSLFAGRPAAATFGPSRQGNNETATRAG